MTTYAFIDLGRLRDLDEEAFDWLIDTHFGLSIDVSDASALEEASASEPIDIITYGDVLILRTPSETVAWDRKARHFVSDDPLVKEIIESIPDVNPIRQLGWEYDPLAVDDDFS